MPPNSALTRWIKQGLARGECPLCRVAHKAEYEYLWYFFDEYSTQDAAMDELTAAHGFCARHAGGLRRIEVDNLRSTLGLSQTYEDVLGGVVSQLERLGSAGSWSAAPCPACAYRDGEVERQVGYLLELLQEHPATRARFESSPGLCLPHFGQVWANARGAICELLRGVQLRAAAELRDQLTEHIRKQGAEARDEAPGPEADAWERAINFTAGWPAADLED